MQKPKFSLALIAKNEALTLPRLIGSLKEFQERGGDIWVLDTGSTDDTIEVAKSLGCNVEAVGDKFRITVDEELANKINTKFVVEGEEPVVKVGESLFDFASARNYISTFPENDFIFTPDCDEIFTKFDIDKIDTCIEAGIGQLEYNFVFSHDNEGNPVIKFTHCKAYDRTKLRWQGVIHEILVGDASRQFLGEDTVYLEHYQNEQTNRSGYLKGLAIDCFNNPDNDRNSHYFAREMMYLGRTKSAIKEFLNHISMGRWGTEAAQSMLYVGDCYARLGDTDEMLKWYSKSIEKEARREPLMRLAEYYFNKGAYHQVIAYAEAALSVTQLPFYSNHQPYYENVPHELLYIAYWWTGNRSKSLEHYLKALAWKPNHPKYIADGKFYTQADIEFTGERYIPGINRPDMEEEHYARYNFASKFTEGKVVLDAACGAGYGKDILKAKTYYGVDVAEDVVADNTAKYGEGFSVENLENGVTLDIKPDVVVTFETIEHLEDPSKLLEWIKANSKRIIFSIPVNMPSEFHKVVYSIEETKSLMNKYFFDIEFYEQDGGVIVAESSNPRYIVGVAYCEEQPKITFVIPTLGRESGLKRCTDSIEALNYPKNKIEVIIKQDSFENRIGVPILVKKGVEESTGEWVVFASNDTEFTPESINEALLLGGLGYVAYNTGEVYEDEGNANEHFMIRKDIIEKIGEVFDTDFWHAGCDNLLMAKMKKLGIFVRAEKAVVKHYHFSKGEQMDKVYEVGWLNIESDRVLLAKKLAELL